MARYLIYADVRSFRLLITFLQVHDDLDKGRKQPSQLRRQGWSIPWPDLEEWTVLEHDNARQQVSVIND